LNSSHTDDLRIESIYALIEKIYSFDLLDLLVRIPQML